MHVGLGVFFTYYITCFPYMLVNQNNSYILQKTGQDCIKTGQNQSITGYDRSNNHAGPMLTGFKGPGFSLLGLATIKRPVLIPVFSKKGKKNRTEPDLKALLLGRPSPLLLLGAGRHRHRLPSVVVVVISCKG